MHREEAIERLAEAVERRAFAGEHLCNDELSILAQALDAMRTVHRLAAMFADDFDPVWVRVCIHGEESRADVAEAVVARVYGLLRRWAVSGVGSSGPPSYELTAALFGAGGAGAAPCDLHSARALLEELMGRGAPW